MYEVKFSVQLGAHILEQQAGVNFTFKFTSLTLLDVTWADCGPYSPWYPGPSQVFRRATLILSSRYIIDAPMTLKSKRDFKIKKTSFF